MIEFAKPPGFLFALNVAVFASAMTCIAFFSIAVGFGDTSLIRWLHPAFAIIAVLVFSFPVWLATAGLGVALMRIVFPPKWRQSIRVWRTTFGLLATGLALFLVSSPSSLGVPNLLGDLVRFLVAPIFPREPHGVDAAFTAVCAIGLIAAFSATGIRVKRRESFDGIEERF